MLITATVPALREELRLLPATPQPDGSPAWHILDPVRNRFFRIGWLEFELLCRWALGRPEAIARAVAAETTLAATADDVAALAGFLDRHALLVPEGPRVAEVLAERARRQRGAWWQRGIHQYLFFRVPLVFPQARLADVARRLHWAWSPAFLGLTAVAGAVGVDGVDTDAETCQRQRISVRQQCGRTGRRRQPQRAGFFCNTDV